MNRRQPVVRPWRWRVREIIAEKGLSISEVARRAGVHPSTVRAFCRNPQHETTTLMWGRLAEALGVPLAEILEVVPEMARHTFPFPPISSREVTSGDAHSEGGASERGDVQKEPLFHL
ncbi:MAG TPA: helix-turn-helix transcriptional regulator [Ktedonobacteraceae bacterium]|nr:helix-turn-helix transcriptional regulator [Ktedonobacteraceae bacterium]